VGSTRARVRDWISKEALRTLDRTGFAVLPGFLPAKECRSLADLYEQPARFRSRVVMARHGYGRGEYQYFRNPLPRRVGQLRTALYRPLVSVANRWMEAMGRPTRYPGRLREFLAACHAAGQTRPTPLLLKYGPGDFNCLHQDLYGAQVFPIQVAVLLSQPGEDFEGGDFVLTQQRPRMQSRVDVVPLRRGDAVAFAVNERPVQGTRSVYRIRMRHGVSELRRGRRLTLGIIFHDAA
jgi:uncharacterized protein